jgi:CRISPR-associated protein (TIGR03986 family)
MEKALLLKKGKGWQLRFETSKEMTLNWNNIPLDWENCNIDVRRQQGQPVEIKKDETIIKKPIIPSTEIIKNQNFGKPTFQKTSDENTNQKGNAPINQQEMNQAFAPYNFVPLNETIIFPEQQTINQSKFENNSGYIDITIENLTHLMISSGKQEGTNFHDFLKIGKDNKPIIPGSSIRGLIKNMVEILSYSQLIEKENFENKPLFYRSVFGKDSLTNEYLKHFAKIEKIENNRINVIPKIKAGYLCQINGKYLIKPSRIDNISKFQYHRVFAEPNLKNNNTEFDYFKINGISKNFAQYEFLDIYFKSQNPTKKVKGPLNLTYPVVSDYKFKKDAAYNKGCLVITGDVMGKKHYQWIINDVDNNKVPIEIDRLVIEDYKSDSDRLEEYDLIKMVSQETPLIPCFYLSEVNQNGQEKISAFGHTGNFRIKHKHEIKNAIAYKNQPLRSNLKYDLTQLMFGIANEFSSRLFFEDAILLDNPTNYQEENFKNSGLPPLIKILSNPKITSHQLYIKQENESGVAENNWSSKEIKIRGYKQYWHKKTSIENWAESIGTSKSDSHTGFLKAIKPNHKFSGKIRFENLTDIELGALLSALDLHENCNHKIGMGKPYGLGTIKIESQLAIIYRPIRYKHLMENINQWNLAKSENFDKNPFKRIFAKFILGKFDITSTENYEYDKFWTLDRIKELKSILEYDEQLSESNDWLEATRYMEIKHSKFKNEYKSKSTLPKPSTFKKKFNK